MSVDTTDPNRIPPERFLTAEGIGQYITSSLLAEFHPPEERMEFSNFVGTLRVTIDPEGEFAFSARDYRVWLRTRKT